MDVPLKVSQSFLRAYYRLLSTTPSDMSRFYQESSHVTQEFDAKPAVTVTGLKEIKTHFASAAKRTVDLTCAPLIQPSLGDSLLIVATGRSQSGQSTLEVRIRI